jgi:hypothetical protein
MPFVVAGGSIAAELFDVADRLLCGWIRSFALPDLAAASDPQQSFEAAKSRLMNRRRVQLGASTRR